MCEQVEVQFIVPNCVATARFCAAADQSARDVLLDLQLEITTRRTC
jgi:hypothetical protein